MSPGMLRRDISRRFIIIIIIIIIINGTERAVFSVPAWPTDARAVVAVTTRAGSTAGIAVATSARRTRPARIAEAPLSRAATVNAALHRTQLCQRHTESRTSYRPGGGEARRYAPRRRQFDSRRIYVRPRTGPQSTHG